MSRILKWVLGYTTIIGTIMLAFYFVYGFAYGGELTFITKHSIPFTNVTMYEFRIYDYFKNIQDSLKLYLIVIPSFPDVPDLDWDNVFKALANCVLFGFNVVIWLLNMYMVMPVRMIFYIIMVIFSILGLKTNILVDNLQILFTFSIPFIDYIS